jgi:putative two-component system response regulator
MQTISNGLVVSGDPEASSNRILVVDDEEGIRRLIARVLERHGFECETAANGRDACDRLAREAFDLVLTDVDMPLMSGIELVEHIVHNYPNTATVMVTAMDDTDLASSALGLGAYGYIIKPFESNEIVINVWNALRRRALEIENLQHRTKLERTVRERTSELWKAIAQLEGTQRDLRSSREETIRRLSIAAEFRDDETGKHIQRMSHYCELLARLAGVDTERQELIRMATQMHDVGKIGIPDDILLKPGKLTNDERAVMQRHAEIGHQILSGANSELLDLAATIAHTHHERVDGTGYPRKLEGDEIPLEGRITAIADVFDALTSDRVYKRAFPIGKALNVMREGRGTHFDAELLDLFLGALAEVLAIKERYSGA